MNCVIEFPSNVWVSLTSFQFTQLHFDFVVAFLNELFASIVTLTSIFVERRLLDGCVL